MKKQFIVEVEFFELNSNVSELDIVDYLITAIEEYSLETGYCGYKFNYTPPFVHEVRVVE